MEMSKKISTSILVGLVAVTAFVGCSSESASKTEGADGVATSSEKTVLKVWGMGEEGKLLSNLEADFETENPDIDMQIQALPWDGAHDKLLMAVASGDGPDVVQMGTSWIPEFADAKALMDLEPYLAEYPNLDPKNYYEGSIEAGTYNDTYVGVPWYIDTRVMYYRTDLLEEVGYAGGPATWEEAKDAADKLSARGEGLWGMDLNPKDQFFTTTYAWQNGAEILKDGKPQFTEPEFVEAVEYINSFFVDGASPVLDDMDIIQAFKEGIKPMFISGPWMIPGIKSNAPEIEGKWAVRTLPAKKTNTSFVGGANLTIFESSKNKDAALKLLSYLTEVETQIEWLDIAACLPSRTEAWNESVLKEDELYSVFGEQMNNAKPSPVHVQWEAIAQEINGAMERINVGGADIMQELEALNKVAMALMQE